MKQKTQVKEIPNGGVVSIVENKSRNLNPKEAFDSIEEIMSNFRPEDQNEIIDHLVEKNAIRRWNEHETANNLQHRATKALDIFMDMHPRSKEHIDKYRKLQESAH